MQTQAEKALVQILPDHINKLSNNDKTPLILYVGAGISL
jgi:hypothetical protein